MLFIPRHFAKLSLMSSKSIASAIAPAVRENPEDSLLVFISFLGTSLATAGTCPEVPSDFTDPMRPGFAHSIRNW